MRTLRPKHALRQLIKAAFLIVSIVTLAACGGGGDSSRNDPDSNIDDGGSNPTPGNDGGDSNTNNCTECIRINEVVASNSAYKDEDGDSPDWLELHNYGTTPVNLNGWSLTDDRGDLTQWSFSNQILHAGGYLKIWASGKDRSAASVYRALVDSDDIFAYRTTEPNSNWKELSYDDSDWRTGRGGIGYGDEDDATTIASGTQMLYLRKTFQLSNTANIQELWLDIDYDDAFVAYINGHEIARGNIIGNAPAHNDTPIVDREAQMYQGGSPERYQISDFASLLNEGDNVLSIQVHNISNSSSDLTIIPFLTALFNSSTSDGAVPSDILGFAERSLHTNFKISSAGETLYLFDANTDLVDTMEVTGLANNVSIGIDNSDQSVRYYETTTPGARNADQSYQGVVTSELSFSHPGGAFEQSRVSINGAADNEQIRYTLDATLPTSRSTVYDSSINISSNRVIRARAFRSGYIPSKIISRAFLPDAVHDLPIVSLITEPDNFFDHQTGLYVPGPNPGTALPYFDANFWQDWERDIHFSFYEPNGDLGVALDAGVKIFGAWSRANDQRSLAIYARGRYGQGKIDYPLFPQLPYSEFESIILRNSGTDWLNSMMRDAALTSLMDGSGLDTQAYRPTVVYLNGEYWGLYNLREKVNEDMLASKHGVEADSLDILEANAGVVEGSNSDYLALIDYVDTNSLADEDHYNYVASQIDIDNYIRYFVAQIYFNNQDWPGNNIKYWRSPGEKWRWILYDTDFGFGIWNANDYSADTIAFALETNGPGWPNPPWSTLLLRRLMENDSFKEKFIRHFNDELNTRFLGEHVSQHITEIAAEIESEIPRQWERWSESAYLNWQTQVTNMKRFAEQRNEYVFEHLKSNLGAGQLHSLDLSVNNTDAGHIELNSLTLSPMNWQGQYFADIPLQATAIAAEGFTFSHWEGLSSSTNPIINFSLNEASSLTAVFTATP